MKKAQGIKDEPKHVAGTDPAAQLERMMPGAYKMKAAGTETLNDRAEDTYLDNLNDKVITAMDYARRRQPH